LKKALAILLLNVYLFSTTELHQLLKMPFLIEHFFEHKVQNTQLTLWEFLCLHYADTQAKDADYEQDMKLPFKSHDCCNSLVIVACVLQQSPLFHWPNRVTYLTERTFKVIEEVFFNSSFHANIWQPPRIS
jgi:hypothetical protein